MGAAVRVLGLMVVLAGCASTGSGRPRDDQVLRPSSSVPVTGSTTTTTTTTTTTGKTTATSTVAATTLPNVTPPGASTTTARPRRTRCRALAHIGDSLTVAMTGEALAPDARLDAQYARVGVSDPVIDGSGGRSIVETLPDQVSAYDAALALRQAGFAGCWVLQVGTNDAANVAAGSMIDQPARIDRMMSVIRSDPVVWVDTVSRAGTGDYARANMQRWDDALADARHRYPALQVFAWSAEARDEWFLSDGVHYTTEGYTALARSLADALVADFPA